MADDVPVMSLIRVDKGSDPGPHCGAGRLSQQQAMNGAGLDGPVLEQGAAFLFVLVGPSDSVTWTLGSLIHGAWTQISTTYTSGLRINPPSW